MIRKEEVFKVGQFAKPHGRLDAQLIEDLELPLTLQHLHHRHNRAIATLRKNDIAYLFFEFLVSHC